MYAATLCASAITSLAKAATSAPISPASATATQCATSRRTLSIRARSSSDHYGSEELTKKDGSLVIGRVVVQEKRKAFRHGQPSDSQRPRRVDEKEIVGRKPWLVSMMPPGLINSLNADELKDLLAFSSAAGTRMTRHSRIRPRPRPEAACLATGVVIAGQWI
jgi:hypothetical protein